MEGIAEAIQWLVVFGLEGLIDEAEGQQTDDDVAKDDGLEFPNLNGSPH